MEKAKNKKSATYDICIIAMFVSLITVCAWISVPIGDIPVSLQTLAVCLASGLLGTKRGTAAVFVYIILGLIGVPVFTGFGATARLIGPTGGYIVGFIATALTVGFASDCTGNKKSAVRLAVLILSMVVGIAMCYAFGTAWFLIFERAENNPVGLISVLSVCVLPYIPFDIVKTIIASALVFSLKKFVK